MCSAIVAVTKEILLDIQAIQWNINTTATILIACATIYQNCSRNIYIPLDCIVVKIKSNIIYCRNLQIQVLQVDCLVVKNTDILTQVLYISSPNPFLKLHMDASHSIDM